MKFIFKLLFISNFFAFGTQASDESAFKFYPLAHSKFVYLAGPLFNPPERREMEDIAFALELAGFKVFLPHRDGLEFAEVFPYLVNVLNYSPEKVTKWMSQAIDALDVYQVSVVNGSLVINMNGRVPDEGAIAELTMAWVLGKPTLIYKNDLRSLTSGLDNPLVTGRANFIQTDSVQEIPKILNTLILNLREEDFTHVFTPPKDMRMKILEGERIWDKLKSVRRGGVSKAKATHAIALEIIDIYGSNACLNFLN
jgi:nucleoside 2-deoxyribosyltransferase